jgi:hypothetical protein
MPGSLILSLTTILLAIANVIPLLVGIAKVRDAPSYGAVAVLAFVVYGAQLLFAFVVGFALSGGRLAVAGMLLLSVKSLTMAAYLLTAGVTGYLTAFAVLAACYFTFVDAKGV